MDKNITVTCSTDNVVALAAFAKAFAEMANIDTPAALVFTAPTSTTPIITEQPAPDVPTLPWDERIHSGSRATNKDGSWTLRRKPKDLTDEQWSARIEEVTAELTTLMNIPVAAYSDDGYTAEDIAAADPLPPVAVTAEPTVLPPPFAIDLPASLAAIEPPLPPVAPVVTDFAGLMKWLTSHHGKIQIAAINEVLAKHGLTAIQQLNQRPDLIPQVVADLAVLV